MGGGEGSMHLWKGLARTLLQTIINSVLFVGVNIEGDRPPLTVGENATIICTSDVTDTTSMEWQYNGEVVVNSAGQQANLTFDPVEDDIHNRQYTCRANASGVSFTSSITITVQGKTLHRGHMGGFSLRL